MDGVALALEIASKRMRKNHLPSTNGLRLDLPELAEAIERADADARLRRRL